MSRRLVLLRHGRTGWNLELRAQGHIDVSLDEVGRAEAAAVAPVLAALRPARLWSSDLARARETAGFVSRAAGLPVVLDPRLRENDLGERSGLTPAEFEERFPAEYAAWRAGDDAPPVPGSETRAAMVARAVPALEECLATLAPGETGVVVGHGWCLRAAIVAVLGWPAESNAAIRGMDNCGWATLSDSGPKASLRLESYNETAHVGVHLDFASDGPVG